MWFLTPAAAFAATTFRLRSTSFLRTAKGDLDHIPVGGDRAVAPRLLRRVLATAQEAQHHNVVEVGEMRTQRRHTLVVAECDAQRDRRKLRPAP